MRYILLILLLLVACTVQEATLPDSIPEKIPEAEKIDVEPIEELEEQIETTKRVSQESSAVVVKKGGSGREGMLSRGCEGEGSVILTHSPMKLSELEKIIPLGRMSGEHVTPTDHQYWAPVGFEHGLDPFADIELFDVYSPADGVIINVEKMGGPDDYRMVIEHSCDFYSIFIHLKTLAPKIASELSFSGRNSYGRIPISAGEVVGTLGLRAVDFSVHDATKRLPGLINEYSGEPWKIYTADPFDYFEEPLRSQLMAKSLRSVEPIGGKIDYDIPGKLIGNWLRVGRNPQKMEYWEDNLAVAYDHIDPSQIRVSFGDYKGEERQFGVLGNSPDPKDIGIGERVTYELVRFDHFLPDGEYWNRIHLAKLVGGNMEDVEGEVEFELVSEETLKVTINGKTSVYER